MELSSYAMNPIEWFRRSMSPQVREKDSTKEVEEAREKLRESGEGSLFDQDDALVDDGASPDAVVKTKKQKATSVSRMTTRGNMSIVNCSL